MESAAVFTQSRPAGGLVEAAGRGLPLTLPSSEPPQARGTACVLCIAPLGDAYYELNGRPTCPACRAGLDGSPGAAPVHGMLAGATCTLLYYVALQVWAVRFPFVAVVAGVTVGSVVRRCAGIRWPTLARWLALAITYLSVSMTRLHFIAEVAPGALLLSVLRAALLLPRNVVELVVLAIGLHEAWQFSKPPAIHIAGPYQVVDERSESLSPCRDGTRSPSVPTSA